jgi:hypothetical protein
MAGKAAMSREAVKAGEAHWSMVPDIWPYWVDWSCHHFATFNLPPCSSR